MSMQDTYKYGSIYVDAVITMEDLQDDGLLEAGERKAVLDALVESSHSYQFDDDWADGSMYRVDGQETPLVLLGQFGGYPGESLDDANAQAAKEWAEDRDYVYSFSSWFGGCESVSLYLNMDDATLEEAEECIEMVEHFDEYPVLDEDLYSELQMKVWDEMIEEMIESSQREMDREFTEDQISLIRELASERYGYWEEGYFPTSEWEDTVNTAVLPEPGTVVQLHQAEKLF